MNVYHGHMGERETAQVPDRVTWICSAFVLGWGVLLGSIVWFGSTGGEPQGSSRSVAFAAPFVCAALIILVGDWKRQDGLVAGAAMGLIGLSLLSFNPVAFPMLVPAALMFARSTTKTTQWTLPGVVWALVPAALLLGALAALIVHDDPARWQTPTGGLAGSSDIVTKTEVAISLGLSAAAALIAVFAPVRPHHPHSRFTIVD